MAVRLQFTSIQLMFLLLCSALLATTLQGVQGEVDVEGPSESECRPYIEKALKKLETGDAQSAEVQDDIAHIVTTDDSETQGDSIEISDAETSKSAEQGTQEDDSKSAEEEIEQSKEEQDASAETGDTQEISAEEKAVTDDSEADDTTKEVADESAEQVQDEASAEENTQETQSEEKQDDTAEQSSVEEATAEQTSVEEATAEQASVEDTATEPASKEEVDEGSVEQEESVEKDASVEEGTEQVPSVEEDGSVEQEGSQEQEDEPKADESAEQTAEESAEQTAEESAEQTDESAEQAGGSVEQKEESEEQKEESGEQKEESGEQKEESGEQKDESIEQEVSGEQKDESAEQTEGSVEQKDESSEQKDESVEQKEESGEQKEESEEQKEESTEKVEDEASQEQDASAEKQESAEQEEGSVEKDASAETTEEKESTEKQESDEKTVEEEESAEKAESVEKTESGEEKVTDEASIEAETEKESTEEEQADEAASTEEPTESEPTPEEDLTWEIEIPTDLRPRDHVTEILHLDEETSATDNLLLKTADNTLKELKRIYENAIQPLETLYKYRDLSNRHFGDPEIFSKPLVLFMGPWSGGKSSIINYLLDNEYTQNSLRTGAEPSPAYFNLLMWGEKPEVLDGTQLAADWTFSGLQKFGQGLEERLRGLKLPNKLLEKINIAEIPGILEVRKQVSRVFPFNDACQWFIDRADIIFLVYDPSKLDVGPETEAILDQLKGREYQTRIILNKADQVKPEELMRVQGALIWNISPLMSSAQPPVMYSTSLWSKPYEIGAPIRLLHAQERAFLRDLKTAIDKRIDNKIASARRFAVRVRNHAKMVDCYLTTYYNHKSVFGNKKLVADQIIEHPQDYHIYEGLSTLTNISRYDLPDPDVYRDFFRLNPLYDFQQLSATCTYFRGCPINRLDIAIAYDLPELVGKYKKTVETIEAGSNTDSSTKS